MTSKPHPVLTTPEDILTEALEGEKLPLEALRLLTSGFVALKQAQEKRVNPVELNALSGMVAYVAYNERISEDMVREIVCSRFRIAQVKELPSRLYQDAIEFLVDLELDKIVN